jgi:hypothetical protein
VDEGCIHQMVKFRVLRGQIEDARNGFFANGVFNYCLEWRLLWKIRADSISSLSVSVSV